MASVPQSNILDSYDDVVKESELIERKISLVKDKKKITTTEVFECVMEMFQLNVKLLGMVGELKAKHGEVVDTQATYAQIASSSPQAPPPASSTALSTELLDVTTRLDNIEQETLSNVVSCQGNVMEKLIVDSAREGPSQVLKKSFIETIKNSCKYSIQESEISSVVIRGRENKKHVKVELVNKSSKTELIRAIRTVKPKDLYINDYLTAKRSKLFFDLRQLKKVTPKLKSVFPWNGFIKCKLENDRYVQISCQTELDSLKVKLQDTPA